MLFTAYTTVSAQSGIQQTQIEAARRAANTNLLNVAHQFEEISIMWKRPETSVAIRQCVSLESADLLKQHNQDLDSQSKQVTSRQKLESVQSTIRGRIRTIPIAARARCGARWITSVGYFINKNTRIEEFTTKALPEGDANHAYFKSMLDDLTPSAWASINIGLRASNSDAYFRTGPWALKPATAEALSNCKNMCRL